MVFFLFKKEVENQFDFKKSLTFESNSTKMKYFKHTILLAFCFSMQIQAQDQSTLVSHFKSYYAQMQQQGDIQGVINAMTHLVILEPNVKRKDTLAALYMNEGKYAQALNLIGIELSDTDTNLATEVKAVSLKSLNEPKRAIAHYEVLYKQKRTVSLAYELADLKIQTNDLLGATSNITYGIANSKDDIGKAYYDSQPAYQVPVKSAFIFLKALVKFRENPETNIDAAIALLDEALQLAPNFRRATLTKDALLAKKNTPVNKE